MNIFDAIVIGLTIIAVVMGYRAGLLRSLATIFGYILAAPVAIALTPKIAGMVSASQKATAAEQNGLVFLVILLVVGLVTSALLRSAVSFAAGESVSVPDSVAGAALGAVRVMLLAVLMVLIFERIIPERRQPAWLSQSALRPLLSAAGQQGVRTLPPNVVAQIDRMKRERGI